MKRSPAVVAVLAAAIGGLLSGTGLHFLKKVEKPPPTPRPPLPKVTLVRAMKVPGGTDRLQILTIRNDGGESISDVRVKVGLNRVTGPFRADAASVDDPELFDTRDGQLAVDYRRLVAGDEIAIVWVHRFGEVTRDDVEVICNNGRVPPDSIKLVQRML